MKIEPNEVYTTKEVAEILKVSLPTIKRMLKDKRLTSTRIGKQHRFLGSDILALLSPHENRHPEAPVPPQSPQLQSRQATSGVRDTAQPQTTQKPVKPIETHPPHTYNSQITTVTDNIDIDDVELNKRTIDRTARHALGKRFPQAGQIPPVEPLETERPQAPSEVSEDAEPWVAAENAPEAEARQPVAPPSYAQIPQPTEAQMLSTAELRQKSYMLGKTLMRDIFDEDGTLLFEQGCIVTDLMIDTARKKRKFMDLFAGIEYD